jgi:prophage regulatory protein
MESILRLPEVMQHTGLKRATIYLYMSKQEFPKSIRLGRSAVGWLASDINAWIAGCIKSSVEGI